ncbi:class I SAM-dependent methyltransferase [Boudabousia marimammalium]|uniref:Methyltransferase small domain-containing protein n=1 Tax=Boudabousia marimammalium TaxID=156892 RepID=A0A1Q5PP91_9ACTO|nr:methyltransferase [Boudabousia marimammalium]OKL49260.1 hypothetical protein BM477_04535 [Boudabousia marimammalium]
MSEHYFSDTNPATATEITRKEIRIRGRSYQIALAPKVFSANRLDLATQVLLDFVPPPTGRALDLGCGWGPITLALAAELNEGEGARPQTIRDAKVLAVDVNPRALQLTEENLHANQLPGVRVCRAEEALAECLAEGLDFDTIWSNPPVRIGKEALHELLSRWLPLLSESGTAYLVIGNNLGAKSLLQWLQETGWDAQKVKSKKGFAILQVRHQQS